VWDQIGGFDERVFMYGEDIILCKQANYLNIDRVIIPEKWYAHEGGYDSSKGYLIHKGFLSYSKSCFSGMGRLSILIKCYFILIIKILSFLIMCPMGKQYCKKFRNLLKVFQ
jgi:GT2 family glycosyltransferase